MSSVYEKAKEAGKKAVDAQDAILKADKKVVAAQKKVDSAEKLLENARRETDELQASLAKARNDLARLKAKAEMDKKDKDKAVKKKIDAAQKKVDDLGKMVGKSIAAQVKKVDDLDAARAKLEIEADGKKRAQYNADTMMREYERLMAKAVEEKGSAAATSKVDKDALRESWKTNSAELNKKQDRAKSLLSAYEQASAEEQRLAGALFAAETELDSAKSADASAGKALDRAKKELDAARKAVDNATSAAQKTAAAARLAVAKGNYDAAEKESRDASKALASAQERANDAKARHDSAHVKAQVALGSYNEADADWRKAVVDYSETDKTKSMFAASQLDRPTARNSSYNAEFWFDNDGDEQRFQVVCTSFSYKWNVAGGNKQSVARQRYTAYPYRRERGDISIGLIFAQPYKASSVVAIDDWKDKGRQFLGNNENIKAREVVLSGAARAVLDDAKKKRIDAQDAIAASEKASSEADSKSKSSKDAKKEAKAAYDEAKLAHEVAKATVKCIEKVLSELKAVKKQGSVAVKKSLSATESVSVGNLSDVASYSSKTGPIKDVISSAEKALSSANDKVKPAEKAAKKAKAAYTEAKDASTSAEKDAKDAKDAIDKAKEDAKSSNEAYDKVKRDVNAVKDVRITTYERGERKAGQLSFMGDASANMLSYMDFIDFINLYFDRVTSIGKGETTPAMYFRCNGVKNNQPFPILPTQIPVAFDINTVAPTVTLSAKSISKTGEFTGSWSSYTMESDLVSNDQNMVENGDIDAYGDKAFADQWRDDENVVDVDAMKAEASQRAEEAKEEARQQLTNGWNFAAGAAAATYLPAPLGAHVANDIWNG